MNRESGFTLLELLTLLTIAGIVLGIASLYLKPMETPLQTSTVLVEGLLRQARLQAIATTSAVRVVPESSARLAAEIAPSCAATSWTRMPETILELSEGVTLDEVDWTVCFGSRGTADTNTTITLRHARSGTATVEVLLGGTTRVEQ